MKVSKRQLRRIIREEANKLRHGGLIREAGIPDHFSGTVTGGRPYADTAAFDDAEYEMAIQDDMDPDWDGRDEIADLMSDTIEIDYEMYGFENPEHILETLDGYEEEGYFIDTEVFPDGVRLTADRGTLWYWWQNVMGDGPDQRDEMMAVMVERFKMKITRRELRQIIKEGIDILNSETGELLIFEDDWETGGGDAPEAAARDLMKRLNITGLESSHVYDDDPDVEIIEVSPDDWALIDVELRGKRRYRKTKREQERLDVDNLTNRLKQWAADAGADYEADNPGVDMQGVAWDLADGAQFNFRKDEWDELVWAFESEDGLRTFIADLIVG